MCYNIAAKLATQLKNAIRSGDQAWITEAIEMLKARGIDDIYHTSGFDHPAVLIYTKEEPGNPILARWGFVPEPVKGKEKQMDIWNKTLNARGEDMFETWSFKDSARRKRCLICIDGFFEYYHYKGKTYPYYIHFADNEPMKLAGLWSEWEDKETGERLKTFSIVTANGNELLSKIHNNPKIDGPRMPLILPEDSIDEWLTADVKNEADRNRILELVKPFTGKELAAHTVQRLTGKNAVKNNPHATEKYVYEDLKEDPLKQGNLLF